MIRSARFAVIAALFLLAFACGGGDSGSGGDKDAAPQDLGQDGEEGEIAVDTQEEDTAPPCPTTWVLEFMGVEDGMTVEATRSYTIQARIYDSKELTFIADQVVEFAVTGDGDGALEQTEAMTDEYGTAQVQFNAGTSEQATYKITASNRCTEDVTITLNSVAPEQGTFVVTIEVSPELTAISPDLQITLYMDNSMPMCGGFNFIEPTGVPVPVAEGQTVVEYDDALASSAYLVVGRAVDGKGMPVGGGCVEGVFVLPDRTQEVALLLEPLDFNPVGSYDATVTADVTALVPEALRDPGAELHAVLEDAPEIIAQRIIDELLPYFPEGLPTVCNENEVDIPKEITDSVKMGLGQSFPPAPFPAMAQGSAAILAQALASAKLNMNMTVQPKQADGRYPTKLHLFEVVMSATLPCGAECSDLLTIPFDKFKGGEVLLDWNDVESFMTTSNMEEWALPEYEVSLRPGKLFMLAFLTMVLPAYGLPDSVDEAIGPLFNCSSLVAGISFQTVTCLNKNLQFLSDACQMAVTDIRLEYFNRFSSLLAEQMIKGTFGGQMLDANNDLKADSLSGNLTGEFVLTSGGTPTSMGNVSWPISAKKAGQ